MAEMTWAEAVAAGHAEEMRRDPSIFIMGEDIRAGIYGVSNKLFAEFGGERVIDTPLSEAGFLGAALGAAAVGMRPIVQLHCAFMYVGMDQIVNQVAKMKYMFGGQAVLPVMYRIQMAYGNGSAAHHSDRPHPMYANVPGLKIVMATTPYDAKGLFKTAIRDNDPVLFFEDSSLMAVKGEVPDGDYEIPYGVADVKREGTDVTIVAIAGMVPRALQAAETLAQEGISAEVVDPRTLVPLDHETILKSVAKTHRVVVVDPGNKTCSFASEIAGMIAEEGFWSLEAPVQRLATAMVHPPYVQMLEQQIYPTAEKIVAAAKRTMQ